MGRHLTEKQVVEVWQGFLRSGVPLACTDGKKLKIVYPGRANDDSGADFRDAVVVIDRKVAKGDIEVHIRSSDWSAHHHHLDPVYNRVVLHVVMQDDIGSAVFLQSGQSIPGIALERYAPVRANAPSGSVARCSNAGERIGESKVADILEGAGEQRFMAKASEIRRELKQYEAGQCLYQQVMGALGYSKNKLPFQELARRVPLRVLEKISRGMISEEECLGRQQALLMGTAGLLPSQRLILDREREPDEEWVNRLERLWAASRCSFAMSPDEWHLFKVRPVNFPVRRMAAMSHLLFRFRRDGLLEGTIQAVQEAVAGGGSKTPEEAFVVVADGYWACHFDFGVRHRLKNPTLLGGGRAAEIIINVVLPFAFARGEYTLQGSYGREILRLYHGYPGMQANAVERHMKSQLGIGSLVNSACKQQGLLHIYKTCCTQGLCRQCPLGEAL